MIIAYFLWFDFWTLITNNFESHNSVKLSFRNIWGLCSSFCWLRIFPWIKLSWHPCSVCGLTVYVKEGLPLARDLSLENSADSYLSFRLALLHSVSYFFFLYRSPSSSLCTDFDSISSNMDEVLSINPSANTLSLETLTSIIRTGLPILVQLIDLVNSVIIFLSQITLLRWLTFVLRSQTVIRIVLLFWICFFVPILVFVLQWLSLHWEF